MTKTEFLEELNGRLIVLTEEERRDILDEYEQHIDMKVPTGMTEEEVIASFGKVSDLAADILEAYHVRPDFAIEEKGRRHGGRMSGFWKEKQERIAAGEAARSGDEDMSGPQTLGGKCRKLWKEVRRGFQKGFRSIKNVCGRAGRICKRGFQRTGEVLNRWAGRLSALCTRPFRKRKEEEVSLLSEYGDQAVETGNRERKQRRRYEGMGIGRAIGNMCRAVWEGCLWCLRWIWNLSWIGAGLLLGIGACMALYCMGGLVVLLVLGYPVAGVTIGCLGLTLCVGSVTVFCFTLVRIRKKPERKGVEKEEEMVHA